MDDAGGCGHRALLVGCELQKQKQMQNRAPRWNFKKARWTHYQQSTDEALTGLHLTDPEAFAAAITEAILKCAKVCIPRGQTKGYKPFWNPTLERLKDQRNKARRKAERTKSLLDCVDLRRKQAILTRAIKTGKRDAFRNFLEKLDFRRDGSKAHKFVTTLNNDSNKQQKLPFRERDKVHTTHNEIPNVLCKYYTQINNIKINKREKMN